MQDPNNEPRTRTRRAGVMWLAWVIALASLVGVAGSLGQSVGLREAIVLTAATHTISGWPAIALITAGLGLGRLIARCGPTALRPSLSRTAPALGIGAVLLVIVMLGTLGLLSTATIWCVTAVGLAGLTLDLLKRRPRLAGPPGWLWLGLPGLAVLAVASANPPGALWSSEYNAYDVLSYHLQLPKEWIGLGHTRPLAHNVYSFLPGAIEQAYAALGHLADAPDGPSGLLGGGAWRLSSAHTFHAGLTVLAAWLCARLAHRLSLAAGSRKTPPIIAASLAGALVLNTPWAVVVGSLAYNEMGVVLLGAGALLVACGRAPDGQGPTTALIRAAIAGALVGAACLVKPTALVFIAPPVGVMLLRFARLRDWGWVTASSAAAGLLAISPWLARNALMTGNPVFPLAESLFGTGHWTEAQAARFAAAHAFDGTWLDRLSLLILADPNAGDGTQAVARYRGLSNVQWLLAFPAGLTALAALALTKRSRAIGAGLAMCLALQLVAWLAFTHLQSRFLIPCLVVLAPLVGTGAALARRGGLVAGGALCLLQAGALWTVFAEQRGGEPNAMLGAPPSLFMGSAEDAEMWPAAYINHRLPGDATVLLVGDATPLYTDRTTLYATTWDRPPVLDLLDPGAGKPPSPLYVLVNDAELARLSRSGYLDERLTPDSLARITRSWTLVRSWPEQGTRLYRVPEPSP